jgi:large subunit ribosomal protein L6
MSRVGKQPVKIQSGVKINLQDSVIHIEGPKGKLSHSIPEGISVNIEGDSMTVIREEEGPKNLAALYGTTRAVLANMVQGVHAGFTRELDIVGVGYRAAVKDDALTLSLGYSHPIEYQLPKGVSAAVEKNTHIILSSHDKVLIGEVAAKIRSFRRPEPYQGKGVRYSDERIMRKQGKAAGSK